jgi:hypothetical protein
VVTRRWIARSATGRIDLHQRALSRSVYVEPCPTIISRAIRHPRPAITRNATCSARQPALSGTFQKASRCLEPRVASPGALWMEGDRVTAEDRPLLSNLSADELLRRARDYRRLAETATAREHHEALIRLAERFEKLARERRVGAMPPNSDACE